MTKSDLYAAVRTYLNRPQIPDAELNLFAEAAKGTLNTALREHPRNLRTGWHTNSANEELLPLPYDILSLRSIRRGDVLLEQYGPNFLQENSCSEYAAEGYVAQGNCVLLTQPQDEDTVYKIEYFQSLPQITATSHWVRDFFPDVMLYAMLKEASVALKDRENGPVWAARADQALALLVSQGWNQNVAAGPKVRLR